MKKPTMKLIAVSIFAAAVASCIGCATPSQMYWDHKVKELCEKDGGVTVYEKVELTREEYESLKIPFGWEKSDSYYYLHSKPELIINESPKVWRSEMLLIRRSDNKTLGAQIYFARRGGDLPTGISEPSHYGCSKVNGVNLDLKNSIFSIKGE